MNKQIKNKWLMLQEYDYSKTIYARKFSSIIGVDFEFIDNKLGYEVITQIATAESINFKYVIDNNANQLLIKDFKARSLEQLLVSLELANCLFDDCQLPN